MFHESFEITEIISCQLEKKTSLYIDKMSGFWCDLRENAFRVMYINMTCRTIIFKKNTYFALLLCIFIHLLIHE